VSANAGVVRDLYAAFARKDAATIRRLLHPDVEWIQCAGFPGGGRWKGVDAVFEKVFGALGSAWRDWRAEVDELLDAGSEIVAIGRYVGTHAATGKAMTAVFAHVYRVESGRVTRFRQFTDTAVIARAATS